MPAGSQRPEIRASRNEEFVLLQEIEEESDRRFAEVGIGPFAEDDGPGHLARAAAVLVAGDPPVGFASVEIVDGVAHLWQLSVLPSAGRRGIGSALVEAVCTWAISHGYEAVTFDDLQGRALELPLYERLGFSALNELTPELAAIREHEQAIGDDDFAPRLAMRLDLGPKAQ